MFGLLMFASMGGVVYGGFHGVKNLVKRNNPRKKDAKRIALSSTAAFVISIVGIGMTDGSPVEKPAQANNTELVSSETKEDSKEDSKEQEKIEKEKLEKERIEKEKQEIELLAAKQKEEQSSSDTKLKDLRATLTDLEYDGTQTIEINDKEPIFGPLDLSLENGSWETYGDLDKLNRATSAEAMLNQDLMPTEKRGDISNVEPTGWKNKKLGKSYLYNRTHLIGFALSGENDNWKNLITGTTQLNNPEMLRHEMDIKYYLEQDKNNYVRYSVTPIFKDNELLARGVHLMAKSVNDDTIRFNVYIFNIQDGVELNYADGSSLTEEEIAEKDRIAAQNEDQDRIAAEDASVQAEQIEATTQSQETQYVDANDQGTIKGSNSGIYHLPGSTYYHKTTNVAQWFKTISEAENAGYRAPKR
ncbi:DNA/RNA non-specific endonuclease [Enterococcus sp. DIV1314a]|uniref:DNA/RNA non-specific endonuclease n=1 Tax=Enterococcus sp. DIV1314a TaxID=2774660 RepID=UPI003F68948E